MPLIDRPNEMMGRLLSTLVVGLLALSVGCSSTPDTKSSTSGPLSGTDEKLYVGDMGVEKNYDPNVIMKRAESFFEQEAYPEAVVEYQHFLDLHRAHTLAPYAQYRLAMSHFKMVKTIDRDPDPIHKAIDHFRTLLDEFKGSRYEDDAHAKIEECRGKLAKRHLMVGEFYYRREAYLAAAHRFENVLRDFPEQKEVADALFQLAKTYKVIGADQWAEEHLVKLLNEYPKNDNLDESLELLASLNGGKPYVPEPETQLAGTEAPAAQETDSRPIFTASLNGSTPHVNGSDPHKNGSDPQAVNGHGSAVNGSAHAVTGSITTVAHHIPNTVACTLGEWCITPASFLNGSSPSHSLPPATTSCKIGEWC